MTNENQWKDFIFVQTAIRILNSSPFDRKTHLKLHKYFAMLKNCIRENSLSWIKLSMENREAISINHRNRSIVA